MSRYLQILGAAAPASTSASLVDVGLMVGGGVAGHKMWRRHPVLGALSGVAIGGSILPLARGQVSPVPRLVSAAGGVAASLHWKKHPAWGFVLGSLGASAIMSVVAPGLMRTVLAGESECHAHDGEGGGSGSSPSGSQVGEPAPTPPPQVGEPVPTPAPQVGEPMPSDPSLAQRSRAVDRFRARRRHRNDYLRNLEMFK